MQKESHNEGQARTVKYKRKACFQRRTIISNVVPNEIKKDNNWVNFIFAAGQEQQEYACLASACEKALCFLMACISVTVVLTIGTSVNVSLDKATKKSTKNSSITHENTNTHVNVVLVESIQSSVHSFGHCQICPAKWSDY